MIQRKKENNRLAYQYFHTSNSGREFLSEACYKILDWFNLRGHSHRSTPDRESLTTATTNKKHHSLLGITELLEGHHLVSYLLLVIFVKDSIIETYYAHEQSRPDIYRNISSPYYS